MSDDTAPAWVAAWVARTSALVEATTTATSAINTLREEATGRLDCLEQTMRLVDELMTRNRAMLDRINAELTDMEAQAGRALDGRGE